MLPPLGWGGEGEGRFGQGGSGAAERAVSGPFLLLFRRPPLWIALSHPLPTCAVLPPRGCFCPTSNAGRRSTPTDCVTPWKPPSMRLTQRAHGTGRWPMTPLRQLPSCSCAAMDMLSLPELRVRSICWPAWHAWGHFSPHRRVARRTARPGSSSRRRCRLLSALHGRRVSHAASMCWSRPPGPVFWPSSPNWRVRP